MQNLQRCRLWSPPLYLCGIHNFTKSVFSKGGGFPLCNDLDLIWFLSKLNTPHQLSLFFWARIPRWSYVGHDNLKVELRVFFLIIKSHRHFIFMKITKRTSLNKSGKIHQNVLCVCFHYVLKRNRDNDYVNSENPECLKVWNAL